MSNPTEVDEQQSSAAIEAAFAQAEGTPADAKRLEAKVSELEAREELQVLRQALAQLRVDHADKTQLWMAAAKRCGELVENANKVGQVLVALREALGAADGAHLVEAAQAMRAELEQLRTQVAALPPVEPAYSA